MRPLLFVAREAGSANALAPAIAEAPSLERPIRLMAEGPAAEIWAGLGHAIAAPEINAASDAALAITGTSVDSDLERRFWIEARQAGAPSLTLIDSWINLEDRFRLLSGEGESWPDAVCVLDAWCRDRLSNRLPAGSRMFVTGSPAFEAAARIPRPPRDPDGGTAFVYVSENWRLSDSRSGLFDLNQFQVAAMIVKYIAGIGPLNLIIKPHPSEDVSAWRDWLRDQRPPEGVEVTISNEGLSETMAKASAVIGVATNALVEAAISGVPALAVQPGRKGSLHQGIDALDSIALATEESGLAARLTALAGQAASASGNADPSELVDGATERVLDAVREMISKTRER